MKRDNITVRHTIKKLIKLNKKIKKGIKNGKIRIIDEERIINEHY